MFEIFLSKLAKKCHKGRGSDARRKAAAAWRIAAASDAGDLYIFLRTNTLLFSEAREIRERLSAL